MRLCNIIDEYLFSDNQSNEECIDSYLFYYNFQQNLTSLSQNLSWKFHFLDNIKQVSKFCEVYIGSESLWMTLSNTS